MIAKLDAFGFDKKSLKLVHTYLSNHKQSVKINDSYSSWREILYGVPQGSMLRPLLFNIFTCDIFYFLEDYQIANYADDTTPYSAQRNHQFVTEELEKSSVTFFKWRGNNFIKWILIKVIFSYLGIRRAIIKLFITLQFSYCSFVWMFHSWKLNNKINAIHERALRIAYCDESFTFQ